jgi:hypothetical protein
MAAFTRLTGIPYDPIMVFPHSIAGEEALALLKKHHFLGTANEDNVPAGSGHPGDIFFYLRNGTLDYHNLLSMKRVGAEGITESDIALDLFIGNPLLIYSHHDLFRKGIDSFNRLAETVNRIEPAVSWTSLGNIARNFYLLRKREDTEYDVQAFCHITELANPYNYAVMYYIQKPESSPEAIKGVLVDGSPCPYESRSNGIFLKLTIPGKSKRTIEIKYENGIDLKSVGIEKRERGIRFLRRISDFRDITLSQNMLGWVIIRLYYDSGIYKWGSKRLLLVVFVIAGLLLAIWRSIRHIRITRLRRRKGRGPSHTVDHPHRPER